MIVERYRTPARPGRATLEVKNSVFECRVARVEDEAAARDVIATARREHHDAGHHCSAFVLGPGAELTRSSDDGEPSGTAGAPILQVRLAGADVREVRWPDSTGGSGLVIILAAVRDPDSLARTVAEHTAGAATMITHGTTWTDS